MTIEKVIYRTPVWIWFALLFSLITVSVLLSGGVDDTAIAPTRMQFGGFLSSEDYNRLMNYVVNPNADTTKPQSKPKVVANRYTLAGSDTMFQILFNQIYSPLDVTPRNLDKLKIWAEQNIKKDTSLNNH